MKKILVYLSIIFLCGFIPFGCSKCITNFIGSYNINITNLEYIQQYYYNYGDSIKYVQGTITDTLLDTNPDFKPIYQFIIKIDLIKIAINRPSNDRSFQLYNTCMAYKVEQCYDTAYFSLENKIDSIFFTCDTTFNGKIKNTILDTTDYFLGIYSNKISSNYINNSYSTETLSQLKNNLNDTMSYLVYKGAMLDFLETSLIFTIKRKDNSNNLKFRLKIYLNDGRVLQAETKNTYIL